MRMLIKSPSTGVAPAKMRSLSALGAAGAVAAGAVASGPLAPLNGPLNARPAPARVQRPSPYVARFFFGLISTSWGS